jgi:hypothetical protein
MDVTIAAGSTLTLRAGGQRVTMKTLADARLDTAGGAGAGARVAVIGPSDALGLGPGEAQVSTPAGLLLLPARVVDDGQGMVLALGAPPAPPTQRRNEVRGALELTIHVTLPAPPENPELGSVVVRGRTRNISAGGMLATLDVGTAGSIAPGTVLSIDVELPEGAGRIPVKLTLIEVGNFGLRGSFIDLPHVHAERFARLVFAQERAQLAMRSRRAEVRTGGGRPPGRTRGW